MLTDLLSWRTAPTMSSTQLRKCSIQLLMTPPRPSIPITLTAGRPNWTGCLLLSKQPLPIPRLGVSSLKPLSGVPSSAPTTVLSFTRSAVQPHSALFPLFQLQLSACQWTPSSSLESTWLIRRLGLTLYRTEQWQIPSSVT